MVSLNNFIFIYSKCNFNIRKMNIFEYLPLAGISDSKTFIFRPRNRHYQVNPSQNFCHRHCKVIFCPNMIGMVQCRSVTQNNVQIYNVTCPQHTIQTLTTLPSNCTKHSNSHIFTKPKLHVGFESSSEHYKCTKCANHITG